jgi:hypothetical protein
VCGTVEAAEVVRVKAFGARETRAGGKSKINRKEKLRLRR